MGKIGRAGQRAGANLTTPECPVDQCRAGVRTSLTLEGEFGYLLYVIFDFSSPEENCSKMNSSSKRPFR